MSCHHLEGRVTQTDNQVPIALKNAEANQRSCAKISTVTNSAAAAAEVAFVARIIMDEAAVAYLVIPG